jgi:hypothetical protein
MKEESKIYLKYVLPEKWIMITDITWRTILNVIILSYINMTIPSLYLHNKYQWYALGFIGFMWMLIPLYRWFQIVYPHIKKLQEFRS